MTRNSYANVVANTGSNVEDINENPDLNNIDNVVASNSHPLYLKNVDHPGLILISKKLTGAENYRPWRRSLTISLSAKNKLGIVNGTFPVPDSSSPLKAQWDRVNDMLISWILNTISDEISNGMDYVHSAKDVWDELHEQFSSVNGHRVYQILKDLHTLEQNDKSVELYYHKMKNLWDEYAVLEPSFICTIVNCKCESHKVQDDREQRKRLLQFLMGLHESYSVARGQILMMNPLPTLPQAFSLIKQEEKQRQGNLATSSSFIANAKSNNPVIRNANVQLDVAAKKQLKCSYCHKEGHLKETCFKLIGYPPKGRGRGKFSQAQGFRPYSQANQVSAAVIGDSSSSQPVVITGNSAMDQTSTLENLQQQMTQLITFMKNNNKIASSTPEDHIGMAGLVYSYSMLSFVPNCLGSLWIIDTGASNHMCCDKSLMHNLSVTNQPFQIALPNKQTILVHQLGTMHLTSKLVLQNVLYVPTFNCNLLSVSKLTQDNNCSVQFTSSQCNFQDQNQVILAADVERGGLYYFTQSQASVQLTSPVSFHGHNVVCSTAVSNVVVPNVVDSKLWHLRLGHAPNSILGHIPCIDTLHSCNADCPICPFSKQSILPFPKHSDSHAKSIFDLIHMDVWGPYHISTTQGCNYFLTIVDDYSRATWTFLLVSKQHVFSKFQAFHSFVQKQFNTNIKVVRTDHGSEFLNASFNTYFANLGIQHQKSCTYTPQQNARVERKHKHLLELTRALRFQAGLPHKY